MKSDGRHHTIERNRTRCVQKRTYVLGFEDSFDSKLLDEKRLCSMAQKVICV